MRKLSLILVVLTTAFNSEALDKKIKSNVSEAIVYLRGAQISRTFKVDLPKGRHTIILEKLSDQLDESSVQVDFGSSDVLLLSTSQQFDFFNLELKGELLIGLKDTVDMLTAMIQDKQTENQILQFKANILNQNNRVLGTVQESVSSTWKDIYDFNSSEHSKILKEQLQISRDIQSLNVLLKRYQNQFNAHSKIETTRTSELILEIELEKAITINGTIRYMVSQAGWFPTYDIKARSVNNPLEVVYKANVYQNTGVEWDNINLTFSNANPNENSTLPKLNPFYLSFNQNHIRSYGGYEKTKALVSNSTMSASSASNIAQGVVCNQAGQPLAFANVVVTGSSVGTITNSEGKFKLTLPANSRQITISYVGFHPQTVGVTPGRAITANLQPTFVQQSVTVENTWNERNLSSEPIVEMSYNSTSFSNKDLKKLPTRSLQGMATAVGGVNSNGRTIFFSGKRSDGSHVFTNDLNGYNKSVVSQYKTMPVTRLKNNTSFEVKLDMPYSVPSSGESKQAVIKNISIPAYYEYQCVPKLNKNAFLIARINDWGQYNLLEGEASLYFENTFVGKTVLDVQFITDTLDISLGSDKSILISREKVKSFSGREFIGTDKVEKRQFEITIMNQKTSNINLVVYDQIPVSRNKEITVTPKELSAAKYKLQDGSLTWRMFLKPGEQKKTVLSYVVKFPRNQVVPLE